MAKHRRGEKTAAVSEYLEAHPGAGPKEIVAALAKQRIKITTAHASNIKGKLLKGGTARRCQERGEEIGGSRGTVSRGEAGQAQRHDHAGAGQEGRPHDQDARRLEACPEVLEVIKELGGVKKFKDLAEAMTVTGADAIPF